MAADGRLAELYVAITAKGMAEVQAGIDNVKGRMDQLDRIAQGMTGALEMMGLKAKDPIIDLAAAFVGAASKLAALREQVASGVFDSFAESMARVKKATDFAEGVQESIRALFRLKESLAPGDFARLSDEAKGLSDALASGDYEKHAAGLDALRNSLGFADQVRRAREELDRLKAAVASGQTGTLAGMGVEKDTIDSVRAAEAQFARLKAALPAEAVAAFSAQLDALRQKASALGASAEELRAIGDAARRLRDGLNFADTIRKTREELDTLKAGLLSGATARQQILVTQTRPEDQALGSVRDVQERLFVTAPRVPLGELTAMREQLEKAKDALRASDWGAAVRGAEQLSRALDAADKLHNARGELDALKADLLSGTTARLQVGLSGTAGEEKALKGVRDVEARLTVTAPNLPTEQLAALTRQLEQARAALGAGDWGKAADGVQRLSRSLDLADRLSAAAKELEALRQGMASGEFEAFAGKMADLDRGRALGEGFQAAAKKLAELRASLAPGEFDRLAAGLRDVGSAAASGDWDKAAAGMRELERSLGFADKLQATRKEIEALRSAVASGASGKFALELGGLDRQKQALADFQAAERQLAGLKGQIPAAEFARFAEQLAETRNRLLVLGPAGMVALKAVGSDGASLEGIQTSLARVRSGLDMSRQIEEARKGLASLKDSVASGSLAAKFKIEFDASAVKEVANVRAEFLALTTALQSGDYAKRARELADIGRQMEAVKRAAHWEDMVAQHGRVAAGLKLIAEAADSAGAKIKNGFAGVAGVFNSVRGAIEGATGSLMGWVRQGFQGTTQGAMLNVQFELLSREIASIFIPIMDKVSYAVQEALNWFRQLTGAQQDQIMQWAAGAAAAALVANILPKVAGLIGGLVIPAFRALVGVVTAGSVSMGTALGFATGGLSTLLSLALSLGVGFAVGSEKGRSGLTRLWEALKPIGDALARLGSALMPLWEGIESVVVGAIEGISSVLATLIDLIADAINAMKGLHESSVDFLTSGIGNAALNLGELFNVDTLRTFGTELIRGEFSRARPAVPTPASAGGTGEGHRTVMLSGGQSEDITNLWRRLQSETFRTATESPEVRATERVREEIAGLRRDMRERRGDGWSAGAGGDWGRDDGWSGGAGGDWGPPPLPTIPA